jgi:hypothetical protein
MPTDPTGAPETGPVRFGAAFLDEIAASEGIALGLHANLVDLRLAEDFSGADAGAVFRGYGEAAAEGTLNFVHSTRCAPPRAPALLSRGGALGPVQAALRRSHRRSGARRAGDGLPGGLSQWWARRDPDRDPRGPALVKIEQLPDPDENKHFLSSYRHMLRSDHAGEHSGTASRPSSGSPRSRHSDRCALQKFRS